MISVVQTFLAFTPTNDRQQISILLFSILPNTITLDAVMFAEDEILFCWNIPLARSACLVNSVSKFISSMTHIRFVLFTAQCMVALTSTGEYTKSSPSPGLTKKSSKWWSHCVITIFTGWHNTIPALQSEHIIRSEPIIRTTHSWHIPSMFLPGGILYLQQVHLKCMSHEHVTQSTKLKCYSYVMHVTRTNTTSCMNLFM